jgi:hypothetical protein
MIDGEKSYRRNAASFPLDSAENGYVLCIKVSATAAAAKAVFKQDKVSASICISR